MIYLLPMYAGSQTPESNSDFLTNKQLFRYLAYFELLLIKHITKPDIINITLKNWS